MFRGKRIDNGEWVYGYATKSRPSPKSTEPPYELQTAIDHEEKGVMLTSIVYPDTVDQNTGLKDINNQDIYENDILSIGDIGNYVVAYAEGCFGAWDNNGFTPYRQSIWGLGGAVIGNQHDNPNLLGS